MTWHYGATHDLEELIQTHLFIICPNSSGSTYLKNVLATSRNTWNLVREGQHTPGFIGPSEQKYRAGKLWATQRWIDKFTDTTTYNWDKTRNAWYFQAFSRNPDATVFVEKSPPLLLNVDQLALHFKTPKFIFMVRDPYATVEGIRRRWRLNQPARSIPNDENLLKLAATQVMTCFEYQRRNIEQYQKNSTFFTYETMCDAPEHTETLVKSLLPELNDFIIQQTIPVKDYEEPLRNMNGQQMANLTQEELVWINEVFINHIDLLEYFMYPLQQDITCHEY